MTRSSDAYLAGLVLRGRRVVVVGGGSVAQRRLPGLLAAGADVLLVAPAVTATIEGMLAEGAERLTWRAGDYRADDLDGAWYALALTDLPAVNAAVVADAATRRLFCVRADDGAAGTAVTPATGAQGDVRVAVLGGGDPRRAAAVRDAVVEALREGGLDSRPVRRGAGPADASTGSSLVTGSLVTGSLVTGSVAIVGGGPGDPDLITVRGRRLLAHADVVVADRLAPQSLLTELRTGVEVIDAAKLPRGRQMTQDEINQVLVDRAAAGLSVVRLKGGDPFVFGRGSEEVEACVTAGIPVIVVPGVTSALAAPGLAGIPLTHRGLAHEVVVVSGHLAPDDPRSLVDWSALARLRGTLVVLMGVERLPEIAAALIAHGRHGGVPVAVVQDASLPGQRVVTATLADVAPVAAAAGVRPPAVIVVGAVVALRDRLLPSAEQVSSAGSVGDHPGGGVAG